MENPRVLVIDEDHEVRAMVTSVLTGWGFNVISASDGVSGVERVRVARPAIILLLTPGIATCQQLKSDPGLRDIPVIGARGSQELEDTEKAFRAGTEFLLSKPFGAESLVHMVTLGLESAQDTAIRPRRRHSRFPAEVSVRCIVHEPGETTRELEGSTHNVSLGGLLLLLPKKLEPGTVLRLHLRLPKEEPVTVDGVVIWQATELTIDYKTPHGIRFLGFTQDVGLIEYNHFLSEIAVNKGVRISSSLPDSGGPNS